MQGDEIRALRRLQRSSKAPTPYVFASERGGPMSAKSFGTLFARLGERVASMSHELRTPLNAIIGLTEMMVSNERSSRRGALRRHAFDLFTVQARAAPIGSEIAVPALLLAARRRSQGYDADGVDPGSLGAKSPPFSRRKKAAGRGPGGRSSFTWMGSIANPHAAVRSAHEADVPAAVIPVIVRVRRSVVVKIRRCEAVGDEGSTVMAAGVLPVSNPGQTSSPLRPGLGFRYTQRSSPAPTDLLPGRWDRASALRPVRCRG